MCRSDAPDGTILRPRSRPYPLDMRETLRPCLALAHHLRSTKRHPEMSSKLVLVRLRVLLVAAVVAAIAATLVALASSAASPGNPARGKALYVRPGVFCGSCHTLKAAKSTGRDGPNLDSTRPSYARIVSLVAKGSAPSKRWPTGMPGYGGKHPILTPAMIRDIAAFIVEATHG